jgi:hypothetical protein
MADVFVSYSRKDGEFVQRLNTAFVGVNRVVWIRLAKHPARRGLVARDSARH